MSENASSKDFNVIGLNAHSIYEGIGRYAQLVEQIIGSENFISFILDKRKRGQKFIGNIVNGVYPPISNGWFLNLIRAERHFRRLKTSSLYHSMSPIIVPDVAKIVTVHDIDYLNNFKTKFIHEQMKKRLFNAITKKTILTVSKRSYESLIEYGASEVKLIELCALPVFRKLSVSIESLRVKYGIPLEKKIVLTVGHGKTELVQKASEINGYYHVHVGDGPADLSIYRPDNIQLNEIYNCSDVFVRITDVEGFGSPAMEAMTVGIPIVVSDIQTYRDIYGESAVYAESNVYSISNGLKEALTNGCELVSNFNKLREYYSFERFKKEMIKFYTDVGNSTQ